MENARISAKPLTKEMTIVLLNLIEDSKIIYNKTTNAATNKMKNEEWKRIADQFNAMVTTSYKSPQQLRLKWENLKKNSRKRKTQIRMNMKNGGNQEYIPPDDVLDRVSALLNSTVDGFKVGYGGDAELLPECDNSMVGSENDSDTDLENATSVQNTGDEMVKEFEFTDAGACSEATPKKKKFLFTPRASGSKSKSDENRAARNQAIAEYYNMKAKVLEANLENLLLENKKLKLVIRKLQNRH